MVSFTLSVILCVIAILSIWTKWSDHPVVVTFDDKTTSIGMIPFPSVTICSMHKFIENKMDSNLLEAVFLSAELPPPNITPEV